METINHLYKTMDIATPEPGPTRMADPKPEPGLLRRFHLSYQNILLCHFVAEEVSVLGKTIIIYKFNAIR